MSQICIEIPCVQNSSHNSTPQPAMANTESSDGKKPLTCSAVVYYVVASPLLIVCWLFGLRIDPADPPSDFWGFYKKRISGEGKSWVAHVAIRRRFAVLCLAWVAANLSVPELRSKLLLGSELWKWSLLVTLVSCGYHFCSQGTKIVVYLLCVNKGFTEKRYAEFYAKGTRRSVSWVLYSGSLLLAWALYFRRSWGIKKTSETAMILHIGTWSFATLFGTSLFWLLKTVLVLLWEADTVYTRFENRILNVGSYVYFLDHACEQGVDDVWTKFSFGEKHHKAKMYSQNNKVAPDGTQVEASHDTNNMNINKETKDSGPKKMAKLDQKNKKEMAKLDQKNKKEMAKRILFGDDKAVMPSPATMQDIKHMADFFVNFSNSYRKDEDLGVLEMRQKIERFKPSGRDKLTEKDFIRAFHLEKDVSEKLLKSLNEEHGSKEVSYENFKKSMDKAHKNCVDIGRTLFDAREVVKLLDRVWIGIVAVIATIAWLLLTDIVSTKMLVLIVSPFLAATFVFGDTCKTMFEGVIFSFINHPFDVGDRCIIENNELKVKCMSVFSTTFKVINNNNNNDNTDPGKGAKKELLYPNSTLASTVITRLKDDPDRDLKQRSDEKIVGSSTFS